MQLVSMLMLCCSVMTKKTSYHKMLFKCNCRVIYPKQRVLVSDKVKREKRIHFIYANLLFVSHFIKWKLKVRIKIRKNICKQPKNHEDGPDFDYFWTEPIVSTQSIFANFFERTKNYRMDRIDRFDRSIDRSYRSMAALLAEFTVS